MQLRYNHSQISYAIILPFLLMIVPPFLLCLYYEIYMFTGFLIFTILPFLIYYKLKVSIDSTTIYVSFGVGIFGRNIGLKDIKSIKQVRNRWYHGFGMKIWYWPRMDIYSVNGFDAVEIVMKNDFIYRVGTNEPEKLLEAISEAIRDKDL